MKRYLQSVVGTALLLALAAPLHAQKWSFDLGPNVGASWYSDILDDGHLGTDLGGVKFKPGWLLGLQATGWLSDRLGLRANTTWTDRPLMWINDHQSIEDVNLWSVSGDLMFRFGAPEEGKKVLPYFALGAGMKVMDSGDGPVAFSDADHEGSIFIVNRTPFLLSDKKTVMGLAALGMDWRLSRGMGLRLEVGDRIYDPPMYTMRAAAGGFSYVEGPDEDVGNPVHEIFGQLGLQFLFGVEEEIVAAAPPPPPPPAPEPVARAAPPPPPEQVTVCVVDPTTPGGIRMETATIDPTTRDTTIMVGGSPRRLREATGNVMVASQADWFVRGQPLTLTIGRQKTEFVTYGTSRLIEGRDLAFLGTVNGVPVYANAADVQDVREELEEANKAQAGQDLGKILEERKDLREDLEDITVVYVPLQPTGCVFQGLQRVEPTLKGQVK